jgi:hypothetical protein
MLIKYTGINGMKVVYAIKMKYSLFFVFCLRWFSLSESMQTANYPSYLNHEICIESSIVRRRCMGSYENSLPISSGKSAGRVSQRSAWALRSMSVTAPGRGSLKCCFGRIPLRRQITSARLIISAGGIGDGFSTS